MKASLSVGCQNLDFRCQYVETICNLNALLLDDEKFVSDGAAGTQSQTVSHGGADVDDVIFVTEWG